MMCCDDYYIVIYSWETNTLKQPLLEVVQRFINQLWAMYILAVANFAIINSNE